MICPSCNKFAAYDTSAEPELDLSIEDGEVTGTARIVLTSECCGDELKESTFDVEIDLTREFEEAIRAKLGLADDAQVDLDAWEFGISQESAELTERMEAEKTRTKKDGTVVRKPIPFRYQRRYFGVHVDVTVTASKDGLEAEVEGSYEDEVQASGMDELT